MVWGNKKGVSVREEEVWPKTKEGNKKIIMINSFADFLFIKDELLIETPVKAHLSSGTRLYRALIRTISRA